MKEPDFRPKFEALIRESLGRVPFLRLTSLRKEEVLSSERQHQPDWVARVSTGSGNWTLVLEAKRIGHPREVRAAVLQLEDYLRHLPKERQHYGVLLAPFLSEESARICTEAGVGYADLAGNTRLSFDKIFIETKSAENPFKEKRETRSLFGTKAARVLRVLLQGPLHPWKVTELAEASRVSIGWVSAVRQQLLGLEWAEEQPGGLRVSKPGAVLDAWAKADDWEKRTHTQEYSVLLAEPLELGEKVTGALANERPVFTQWFAGWLRHPYTTPPVVTAYVTKLPDDGYIKERLLGRKVPAGGGRLRLVLPNDEGVLHPAQSVRGFDLVSDVQIYLDLQRAGLRAEEQAEELRKWPDFAGGWA